MIIVKHTHRMTLVKSLVIDVLLGSPLDLLIHCPHIPVVNKHSTQYYYICLPLPYISPE